MFAARLSAGIVLSFLLSSVFSVVPAQPQPAGTEARLISAAEGEAIVEAAWQLRRGLVPKPDCSHFVHAVYERAGFLYEYAASKDVFAGIADFRRVRKPQPGDLVVWPGHIGIVIDPREHSFYSSVLSGFAIENYQSNYWVRRGNPRFYRFAVNDSPSAPRVVRSNFTRVPSSDQVLSTLMRPFPAPIQPSRLKAGAAHESSGQQSARVEARAHPEAETAHMVARRPQWTVANSSEDSRQASARAETERVATRDAEVSGETFVTWRATPSRREVLAAITRSADDNGERLLRGGLLSSRPAVGVVDHFRIVALDFQDNVGLADLEVKEIAMFQYGTAKPYQLTARRRVILSRQKQGWILLEPQELMYLNRHLAATALTNQLGTLAHAPADQREARKAVQLLHELLSAKSAGTSEGGSD